jgi:lipase ATG15
VNAVRAGYGGANYTNVFITGASLGGGVAMISGAQTGTPTVSISGPGPILPRKIFHPPLTVESIDSNVYNFIPERDYIARLGGRPMFYQNAMCIASNNNLFGCHSMWRSFCEINYRCGSNGRPVACRCVERFGYPKPIQNGTRTFEEACAAANETWYEMFPDVPN